MTISLIALFCTAKIITQNISYLEFENLLTTRISLDLFTSFLKIVKAGKKKSINAKALMAGNIQENRDVSAAPAIVKS